MFLPGFFVLSAFLAAFANAHVQLQFPPPRGPFNDDDEVKFCDGYNSVGNRSTFPLNNGFFSINSTHSPYSAGVIISTSDSSISFNDFSQYVPFFQFQQAGSACFPLNFSTPVNGTTFQDGQNVTIQIVYDGGDGKLYQCADLTLSNNFTIPSNVTCANTTATSGTGTATHSGASATHTSGTIGRTMPSLLLFTISGFLGLVEVL